MEVTDESGAGRVKVTMKDSQSVRRVEKQNKDKMAA